MKKFKFYLKVTAVVCAAVLASGAFKAEASPFKFVKVLTTASSIRSSIRSAAGYGLYHGVRGLQIQNQQMQQKVQLQINQQKITPIRPIRLSEPLMRAKSLKPIKVSFDYGPASGRHGVTAK